MGFSHSLLHARGLLWCLTHVSGIELNCTLAWGQEEEKLSGGQIQGLEDDFGLFTVCSLGNIRTARADDTLFSQFYRLKLKS